MSPSFAEEICNALLHGGVRHQPEKCKMYTWMYTLTMKDLSVTEFRRQCLALLDHLPEEGLILTRRGKPLARVTPLRRRQKGRRVKLPLLKGKGRPGPLCPNTETPYDLVFD
jgi:antitoxin (DNA-binding transcriptional repressor) of toxin-antitoxin stability system